MDTTVDVIGQYLYCFIETDTPHTFTAPGIGPLQGTVHTIHNGAYAAVVSESPVTIYESRRRNMMAHTRVLEEVMADFTILPARFSTVIPPEDDLADDVIAPRTEMLGDLFIRMEDKVELGLKAFWHEDLIYKEIVEQREDIRRLRDRLVGRSAEETHYDRMRLGEMVEQAVKDKQQEEGEALLEALHPLAAELNVKDVLGDRMVLNTAFLVDRANEEAFDAQVNDLSDRLADRMTFKYVGPVPPYNFVNIVI